MNVLRFFAREAPSRLFLAVVVGVVGGFGSVALLAIFNNMLKHPERHPGFALAALLLGLCSLLPLTRFISEVLVMQLCQKELFRLRTLLSRRILQTALRHLELLGPERFMVGLSDDIPEIADGVELLPTICINLALSVSGLIYLAWLSWRVFLVVLFFLVLGVLATQLPVIWALKYFNAAHQQSEILFGHYKDLTEGVKELKLHSQRRSVFFSELLRNTALLRRRHYLHAFGIYTAAASVGQMLVFLAIGVILFSSVVGHPGMAALTGSIIAVIYITQPLQSFMNAWPFLSNADAALQRWNDLMAKLEEPGVVEFDHDLNTDVARQCEDLTLKAITYAYHDQNTNQTFTLGPIDMVLRPGQLVILAGGNGSGKTTLAKIIAGLYSAESGEVLLDGKIIDDENRGFYRQHFSAIFYDFHLFEQLLGLEQLNLDERAKERLIRLQLNHKVSIQDGVLSTTQLSQGQRKRLALLTASLEDRPIYVFDEWAADQDPRFKEFFYRQLLPDLRAEGKMVLIICHDDHYFDIADRIIRLDSGKIVYDGAPAA